MVKEPRENRVHIMFSDEELRELDDWGFENRIRTRAQVIRRLCQIGIFSYTTAPTINAFQKIALEEMLNERDKLIHEKGLGEEENEQLQHILLSFIFNVGFCINQMQIELENVKDGKDVKLAQDSIKSFMEETMKKIENFSKEVR